MSASNNQDSHCLAMEQIGELLEKSGLSPEENYSAKMANLEVVDFSQAWHKKIRRLGDSYL